MTGLHLYRTVKHHKERGELDWPPPAHLRKQEAGTGLYLYKPVIHLRKQEAGTGLYLYKPVIHHEGTEAGTGLHLYRTVIHHQEQETGTGLHLYRTVIHNQGTGDWDWPPPVLDSDIPLGSRKLGLDSTCTGQ
jgi:hypothetical protein